VPALLDCFSLASAEGPLILSFSAHARLGALASSGAAPIGGRGLGEGTLECVRKSVKRFSGKDARQTET